MEDIDEDPTESPQTSKLEPVAPLMVEASGQADPESRISVDEHEEEDEQTHDYRFLASLAQGSRNSSKDAPVVPRRGEKDFEPHGTIAQSSTLLASQNAMHDALSHERVHGPGAFDLAELPNDGLASSQDTSVSYMNTVASKADHLVGFFDADTTLTFVPKQQGVWFRTIGRAVKGGSGGVLLEPEEALFLCERGTLDLRFGSTLQTDNDIEAEDKGTLSSLQGLPMSIQAVYACCIGARGLTLERYLVYTGLRRTGYIIFRAPGAWEEEGNEQEKQSGLAGGHTDNSLVSLQLWFQTILNNLSSSMTTKSRPGQPLIGTGFFRDYATIYKRLSIIPSQTSSSTPVPASTDYPALSVTFHAYRPTTRIRKSKLPPPELYITVVDARENDFPTATQLTNLIASIPISPITTTPSLTAKSSSSAKTNAQPQPQSQPQAQPQTTAPPQARPPNLYVRLKSGKAGRNIILAVVDCGLVSYIRVSEGLFANEAVWKNHASGGRGGKGSFGGNKRGGKRR